MYAFHSNRFVYILLKTQVACSVQYGVCFGMCMLDAYRLFT